MNHDALIKHGLSLPGVSMQYPFDPGLPVLFVGDKMFALLGTTGQWESVNLKVVPEEAWILRQQYPETVLPGYHMNKKHWNTVILDGAVPDGEIVEMLELSYRLVYNKLTRKAQMAIETASKGK